jgi:hypothetical protein
MLRLSVRDLCCLYAYFIIYACLVFELRVLRDKIIVHLCVVTRRSTFRLWKDKILHKKSSPKTVQI